jgi:hypothetical protein
MFKKALSLCLVLLLVLLSASAGACTAAEYKTYSLKHNNISFSFEYPAAYKKTSSYVKSDPAAPLSVRFAHADGILGLSSTDPVIFVDIPSSQSQQVAPQIAVKTAGGHTPGQEAERATVQIAGTTGEMVVYASSDYQNLASITRAVFFSVNGVTWSVSVYSGGAKAEEAKNVFDHVLQTFKVPQ